MLRKYRQGGDIQGQGTVLIAGEVKAYLAFAFHFDVLDVGEQRTKAQAALGHQQIETVAYVFGGDRFTVGEAGLGVQVKAQRQAILGALHLLGYQPVDRVGFVQ